MYIKGDKKSKALRFRSAFLPSGTSWYCVEQSYRRFFKIRSIHKKSQSLVTLLTVKPIPFKESFQLLCSIEEELKRYVYKNKHSFLLGLALCFQYWFFFKMPFFSH